VAGFSELFEARRDALRDFWVVYEAQQEAMQEAALVVARAHPVFGPMMQAMTAEQMAQQNAESRENLRLACVEGDWKRYEASLQAQGAMYAQLRIPFASFYDLMRIVDHVLVPALIAAYGKEPDRLAAVLRTSRELFDRAMTVIAERYIETKEEDESISTTLHSIGDGVIATDAQGLIVRMNPVAEGLTGWNIVDARGRPFTEVFNIVNETSGEPAVNPVARVLREGVVVGLANHTALIAKDGSSRPIADSAAPIRGSRGELTGVVLVFRDMTRERAAERAIHDANAFLDSIVENLPDMVFVKDAEDLRFVRFNKAGEALLGVPRADLIGKNDYDFFPKDQADFFVTKDRAVLAGKRLIDIPEEPIETKQGKRWLHTKKIPILGETGEPRYLLGISEDITERKSMLDQIQRLNEELEQRVVERTAALHSSEEQLRQSQKMDAIGRLAGGIAHDFNNLLSVILSYGELMAAELPRADAKHEELREIQRAAKRAAELTRQLLAFSRQQVLAPRVTDLNQVLTGMDKMLARLIGEHIELRTLTTEGLGMVMVDPGQIEQVVMNLVVNARDAMPTGGALTLETANIELDAGYAADHPGVAAGPHVMLAVTDNGVGMSKETRARIFEPFFTTKEMGKGTGLGLSTVHGIVTQSGGHLWVYSEEAKGTSFKIYFPRAEAQLRKSYGALRIVPPRGQESILLVEDEEQVRVLAQKVLTRQGYEVHAQASPASAIAFVERHGQKIDLLLTDVVMPKMSGRELAEKLAVMRPEMKVLFMSGYTDDTIVHHGALDSGIAFLQKPITPDVLARKVREVLDQDPKRIRAKGG